MRKKIIAMLASASILCFGGAIAISGCGNVETVIIPHTEHVFEHVEGKAATCVETGWKEHDRCIYCGKTFIDGVETDVVIPLDNSTHVFTHYDEIYACTVDGVKAHDVCEVCGKTFIDGETVTEEDLVLAATNTHTWDSTGLVCVHGDAYKQLYNGEYYVMDGLNKATFKPCVLGASDATTVAAEKQAYYNSLFSNRMTFFTQPGSGVTVTPSDEAWTIENTNTTSTIGNFTRFAYGTGSQGYVGRFLLTFDVTVSADVTIDRFGAKVVDDSATAITSTTGAWDNVSKLLGANATEENNAYRKFTPNKTYRFIYEIETTDARQMVQIFTCLKGAATIEITNLHCVNLSEKTGKVDYKLVYFGDAESALIAKEDNCDHSFKYDVSSFAATCEGGWVAHEHCPTCGANFINGREASDEDVYLPSTGHNLKHYDSVEATCWHDANIEYWQCIICNKYFADADGDTELTLEQIFTDSTIEHNINEYGECENEGCPVKLTDVTFVKNSTSGGTDGTIIKQALYANPGTWATQGNNSASGNVTGNEITISLPLNSTDKKNAAFVRTVPTQDGSTVFNGKFILHFDFTVTQSYGADANTAKLYFGYFLQNTADGNSPGTIADAVYTFKVGVTYHFAVVAELNGNQCCLQLNVRQAANEGAEISITNAQFIFYPEKDAEGELTLDNLIFMQEEGTAEAAVYNLPEAVLPDNKSVAAD